MTARELRVACAILQMSYADMARYLGKSSGAVQRWAVGKHPVPYMAEKLVNQLLEEHERGADEYAKGETAE